MGRHLKTISVSFFVEQKKEPKRRKKNAVDVDVERSAREHGLNRMYADQIVR